MQIQILHLHIVFFIFNTNITIGNNIRWGTYIDKERIVLDFPSYGENPDGNVKVEYEAYPPRLIITITDIRYWNPGTPNFTGSRFLEDIYSIPCLDDSVLSFAINLKSAVKFTTLGLNNPSRFVIDIKKRFSGSLPRFMVRTGSLSSRAVERIGHLEEEIASLYQLAEVNTKIIQSKKNTLFVELADFGTKEQAKIFLGRLNGYSCRQCFFIEERDFYEVPSNIYTQIATCQNER